MVKYALVTGCSPGGIGAAMCQEFQKQGIHVFATARDAKKLESLSELPNVTALALDVTQPQTMAAAREEVEKISNGRLDYLINNAGAQCVAPLLDFDIQRGRDMYEVNVWGVISVVQLFAPLLVAAKGTVCNIGSISGLLHAPYMGVYGGSKAAINLISETLRLELAPFGVKVITCITGAVNTNIMTNSPQLELPPNSSYSFASREIANRVAGKDVPSPTDPAVFAERLVRDCMKGKTGKVYHGNLAGTTRYASAFAPTSLMDTMLLQGTGLDKV